MTEEEREQLDWRWKEIAMQFAQTAEGSVEQRVLLEEMDGIEFEIGMADGRRPE